MCLLILFIIAKAKGLCMIKCRGQELIKHCSCLVHQRPKTPRQNCECIAQFRYSSLLRIQIIHQLVMTEFWEFAGFVVLEENVEDSLESATLNVLAAEHAGKECFDSGPFILQHADMHWQNLLFDEQCTIVGVIDWEWTQTVPVDSFNLLPWNFASKMLPYRAENATRHQQNSLQQFRALSDMGSTTIERHIVEAVISFQGSLPQYIARYMEE